MKVFSIERMGNDKSAKRAHLGECLGIRLVGQQRKRRIDSANVCLKKRGLNFGLSKNERMTGICKGECLGHRQGYEPLTWTRCNSSGL